jgi:hypothetical protein
MSVIRERRSFLTTAVAVLTGVAAPATPTPVTWAAALPNFVGVPYPDTTPNHRQELLVRLADLDGIRLRTANNAELPSKPGVVLGLYRYEPPDGMSKTVHRLVLPWLDVRAGLYVRSAVPYRLRVLLDPDDGKLATSVVLGRRASVAVYGETPRWIGTLPWQVVVVVT